MVKRLFSKFSKKQYFIFAGILSVCLALVVVGLVYIYQKRDAILRETLQRIVSQVYNQYGLVLRVDTAYFSGMRTVTLEQVNLTPENGETFARVADVAVSVRLLPLLSKNVKLSDLDVNDAHISFLKKDSVRNYDFLLGRQPADTVKTATMRDTAGVDLAAMSYRMLNAVLYKIPTHMQLNGLQVTYQDDSVAHRVDLPEARIRGGRLQAEVFVDGIQEPWQISGVLNPDRRRLSFEIHAEGRPVVIPLLEEKIGLKLSFDTLKTSLREVHYRDHARLHMEGDWHVQNLKVNHWRIAPEDVVLPDGHIDAEVVIGKDYLELTEKSVVHVKKLVAHPYLKLTLKPEKTYEVRLKTPELYAQDLFDAFPAGLFPAVEGIRVGGKLQYQMHVFLDTQEPDSVRFSSRMDEKDFRVNAWGKANVPKLNTAFVYTPYEDDQPVRDIVVGPENASFVRLDDISPALRNAVLTTEDPSFFSHNGFVEEAIRTSIATNYKAGAFRRGGSTISMQLVKNVFLNRNKTMVRKLEEILIVWLMEHERVVSKSRMYEVYLNVIEWGRNIYGVAEASRHYFGKHPSQLDIGESIYLASIVPRPKTGLYSFDYTGGLKPYVRPYFSYIGNIMANRNLTPVDTTGSYGFYAVNLQSHLRPAPPAQLDQLLPPPDDQQLEKEIEESLSIFDRIFRR